MEEIEDTKNHFEIYWPLTPFYQWIITQISLSPSSTAQAKPPPDMSQNSKTEFFVRFPTYTFLVQPQSSQYNTYLPITIFTFKCTYMITTRHIFEQIKKFLFSFLGFLLAPRPVYDENYTKWISPSHFYIAKMFVKHIFKASNKGCFYWIFYSYIIILVWYTMGPNIL